MSASSLFVQRPTSTTSALPVNGLGKAAAVCGKNGAFEDSLSTGNNSIDDRSDCVKGLSTAKCEVSNTCVYSEVENTSGVHESSLTRNTACVPLQHTNKARAKSSLNSTADNTWKNGFPGDSCAYEDSKDNKNGIVKLKNEKQKTQVIEITSVEREPVITAFLIGYQKDKLCEFNTVNALADVEYNNLVIAKQMQQKARRISSNFNSQESGGHSRIYKEEASIVFKKTSPNIALDSQDEQSRNSRPSAENISNNSMKPAEASDAELECKNIASIPDSATDLQPVHDGLDELHSLQELLQSFDNKPSTPEENEDISVKLLDAYDADCTLGGSTPSSETTENQIPVDDNLTNDTEGGEFSVGVDTDHGAESDEDEGGQQGSSTRTSMALLALCVAVLAIAMSHPWSANLSSGLLAATLFFSLNTPSPGPPVDSEKEDAHHLAHRHAHQQEEQQKREEEQVQQDRCVEVYPETVRQRQRNMMASSNKVDIKNWNSSGGNNNNNDSLTSPAKVKKFLPSVKALRNQFEAGKSNSRSETNGNINSNGNGTLSHRSSGSTSSLVSSSLEKTSSTNSLNSVSDSVENLLAPAFENLQQMEPEEPVEPIYNQFKKVDEELRELMSKPPSTTGWNPRPLLKRLYYIPEAPKIQSQGTTYINIEGFLEKLPSGRKKATFWNAWKRRYFVAKDGVLYYYQSTQTEKPSMKMPLMGGKVECMEPSMVGIDDGKGHYVVVRCSSRQEAERWRRALETHTVEDFTSQYVQPWPMPTNPALLRDTLVIDLGSASVRAGVLASQATLPQVFLPSVVATERESRRQVWGFDALAPDVRAASTVSFPIRPSHKITKYSVDLSAVSSLLQKTFAELKVDPKNYHIQLSVPRVLNTNTQTELLRVLFDKFGVRSVNLTHQSILALYAYNATSGIVVDVGERMDIVPVIDGYIVDGGVSRVPYGGYRILDHLRQFLYMRNVSLINEVESYIIRQVLENICYCAHHYNTERARCTNNPDLYEKEVTLSEYFHTNDCPYQTISLDFGRFQATEGLFNPDAWGLDHPGLHKLVHKAIMECSMDIRKEMSRSIFLAGGVTQLPGLVDRLTTEIDNLTPPAIRPKVHASPYRYHAAYIGACVLAESPAFVQSRISREDWNKQGNAVLRKWSL